VGQISISLLGRTYTLRCTDGEEARLLELSGMVSRRVEAVGLEFGQIGDDRILLLTAMLMADEIDLLRGQLAADTHAQPEDGNRDAQMTPPTGVRVNTNFSAIAPARD
jgi:cell division protein ZapA